MKPTGGLRRPPDYCRFRKREQKRPAVSGKRGRPAAPSNRTSLTRHLRRVRCGQLPDRHPAVYKRSRMSMARKIICRDPAEGVEIQFPLDALGRGMEPAQITGRLFQHAEGQTFLRRCRWRLGGRNKKMCVASVVKFRT